MQRILEHTSSVMITLNSSSTLSPTSTSSPVVDTVPAPLSPTQPPTTLCSPPVTIYVPPSNSYPSCGPGGMNGFCKCDPSTQIYVANVSGGGKNVQWSCAPRLI